MLSLTNANSVGAAEDCMAIITITQGHLKWNGFAKTATSVGTKIELGEA